ncbi:MAG: class III signal peptide-containing protein [Candidatus Micrarchaeota archaeon]
MESRGQTAVEYLLLVGAVIFLVVIVYVSVKQNVFDAVIPEINNATDRIKDLFLGIGR